MLSCSVPNQTLITAQYRRDTKKHGRYTPINTESFQMASRNLGNSTFRLWCAFCAESNATSDLSKQRHSWAISPAFIETAWGLPRSTFYRSFKELQEKKYLVPNGPNTFAFHERPLGSDEGQEEVEEDV